LNADFTNYPFAHEKAARRAVTKSCIYGFGRNGSLARMKLLALLLLISTAAFSEKIPVKVLKHTVDGKDLTRIVPGISVGSASSYSNTTSANVVTLPSHTQEITLNHIQMLLLLPDGRRVGVYCNDHPPKGRPLQIHYCKNPYVDELEAEFSGEKVKLIWNIGIDSKHKESETYFVGPVYAAGSEQ
jgi:hypothetical protein